MMSCRDPVLRRERNLPPGVHSADWNELKAAFGGSPRRVALLAGLREALVALRKAGCRTAYIDGSFATAKEEPGDFDACWEAAGVDPDALDPVLLDFSERREAQKERFGGELFPATPLPSRLAPGFSTTSSVTAMTGDPKGIVEIDLEVIA